MPHPQNDPFATPFPLVRYLTPYAPVEEEYPFPVAVTNIVESSSPSSLDTPAPSRPTAAAKFVAKYDLVAALFEVIDEDNALRYDRTMLCNLALVGKGFFRLATTILWSHLGNAGMTPLLNLLTTVDTAGARNMIEFSSLISCSPEWKSFVYYASLVKDIEVHTIDLGSSLIPLLSSLMPDKKPLLPSLLSIFWDASAEANSDLLYLLAPSTTCLTVMVPEFYGSSEAENAFHIWNRRFRAKLSILSPNLDRLTILTTEMYSAHMFLPAYFDSLHDEDIIISMDNLDQDGVVTRRPPFGVRDLDLGSFLGHGSIDLCVDILPVYATRSLQSIRLSSTSTKLFTRSAKLIQHIRPLLGLSGLRRINLHFPNHVLLFTSEQLLQLGSSWPFATDIKLSFRSMEDYPAPDVRSLGPLTLLCPYLKHLTVPTLEVVRGPGNLVIRRDPNSRLTTISVGQIIRPVNVANASIAHALCDAFPRLGTGGVIWV